MVVWTNKEVLEKKKLNLKNYAQLDILNMLHVHGECKMGQLCINNDPKSADRMRYGRAINELIEMQLVIRTGENRSSSTSYSLSPKAQKIAASADEDFNYLFEDR